MPRASGLAARIEEEYGVKADLKEASGGVFEVRVDGTLIFSKKKTGRFPDDDEILPAIGART